MTLPGKAGLISQVRSHPQALAQCERYLNRHGYTAVSWYDTAGGAKNILAANPVDGVAAIASRLAAKTYGLEIVDEGIEDIHHNFTRFFVIGKGEAPRSERAKTLLVFAVPNTPGTLYAALANLPSARSDLTKLESRPRRGLPWQYVFYLDFDGHWQDDAARDAIMCLLSQAAFVKFLGSYPAARLGPTTEETAQTELLQI